MRVTILALGTRGDVQPAMALALGLRRAGHSVRLAAPPLSRDLVESRGLDYAALGEAPDKNARAPSTLGAVRLVAQVIRHYTRSLFTRGSAPSWPVKVPYLERLMEDSYRACEGADAIIFPFITIWLHHVIEKMDVPYFRWDTHPYTATRDFPSFYFTGIFPVWLRLARLMPAWFRLRFNALTHRTVEKILFYVGLRLTNTWRQESLKLPPLTDTTPFATFYGEAVSLYCYSPLMVAQPEDWPPSQHTTGYWFLDSPADWQPPADLVAFLSAGPAPVCVGFGSARDRNPKRLTETVLAALARTGHRGVLLTGRGGMTTEVEFPDDVFLTESVPHDWLFPRVAAVVHHGGAGTTGAVLRAGVPSVVVPWWGDMPFWADRLYRLGVSPRPIPKARLSAPRLAAAIRAAVDETRSAKANALAKKIRAEDGVSTAVEIFERHTPIL